MIFVEQWKSIDSVAFENLALEHVQDIYPKHKWYSTKIAGDEGKDGVGESITVDAGIKDIYWMEAKHKPGKRSIGKYTLDTHLISVFFTGGRVKRLHVVTSGKLSSSFLVRASIFATENKFEFAFSDEETLEHWFYTRPDLIKKYFNFASDEILRTFRDQKNENANQDILARAFIVPERGSFEGISSTTDILIPGLKYLLVVAFSLTRNFSNEILPFTLFWKPDSNIIYLFDKELTSQSGSKLVEIPKKIIFVFPFRLLRYRKEPLPAPLIMTNRGTSIPIPIKGTNIVPRIVSPFVGHEATECLIQTKQHFEDSLAQGKPILSVLKGKAGTGKSRIVEEILDQAQSMNFTTKSMRFTSSNSQTQAEQWRLFFRWVFGIEYNPFEIQEEDLLSIRLKWLTVDRSGNKGKSLLVHYLINGQYDESLFNLDFEQGRWLSDVIYAELKQRLYKPAVVHIEDAHRLSGAYLRPLYILKHLIDSHDALPLAIIISCRTDETIDDLSIMHFIHSLEISKSSALSIHEVTEFSLNDAKEFVAKTLLWPELQTSDSEVMDRIIQTVGTNPFFLMQMIHHISVDKGCVTFGHGKSEFLIDIPAFKRALKSIPKRISNVLSERFNGLKKQHGNHFLEILITAALIGRESRSKLLAAGLAKQIAYNDIQTLLTLGYLSYADQDEIILSHDLLIEGLLKLPEVLQTAKILSDNINSDFANELGDFRCARIFFYAGINYYNKSWSYATRLIRNASEKQEYMRIVSPMEILEKISRKKPDKFELTNDLILIAGYVEQHCGNTKNALDRFIKLRNITLKDLNNSNSLAVHIKATIEASNQHFLRAEVSKAKALCEETISILNDEAIPLSQMQKEPFLSLAHNRLGAVFHFIEDIMNAQTEFKMALTFSKNIDDHYIYAHTLWNLASLFRFIEPNKAQEYFGEARAIWNQKLQHKERFRIMLDTSETYTACLDNNTPYTRSRLFAVASEASEKGYIFQASNALLCYANCCFITEEWAKAKEALLIALNFSAISEDYKTRLFTYHYLTICALNEGDRIQTHDYSWQAQESAALADNLFDHSNIKQVILHNNAFLKKEMKSEISQSQLVCESGGLLWHRFNRA